jgi:PAS domain S-box-containing protein
MVALFAVKDMTGAPTGLTADQQHVIVQLFLAVSAIVSLVVAGISLQYRQVLATLKATNEELEERVTERATRLLESERRFRTLASHAPVGIFETDAHGNYLFVNEKWCELAGMPAATAQGTGWVDALHPDDRERISRKWYEAVRTGREFGSEYRFRTPRGEASWLKGSALAIRDARRTIIGHLGSIHDITERKRAEERQLLLINELNHRVKNRLATVQAVAAQTLRGAEADPDLRDRFEGRLMALSRARDLPTKQNWEGVAIGALVSQILESHAEPSRYRLDGPSLHLPPQAAVAIAMAIHELATNALKYGALSNTTGWVDLSWRITQSEPGLLVLRWQERGGPPVKPPSRKGFGSRLIERNLPHDLGGQAILSFNPDGLVCTITARPGRVQASPKGAS